MRLRKSKIAIAIVTALTMMITMLPAAAFAETEAQTETVDILFSAATADGFDVIPMELVVESNLTETYYENVTVEPEGKVTISDAIVAAHLAVYGEDFEKKPTAYYNVENGAYETGTVTKQFQHDYVGMYYIDGEAAEKGVCQTVLEDGVILEVGSYSDDTYTDVYSTFDASLYVMEAGKPGVVTLFADSCGAETALDSGTKVAMLDEYTGKADDVLASVDQDGNAELTFSQPGGYMITATGTSTYTHYSGETVTGKLVAPYAAVLVNPAQVTSVKATSYASKVKVTWAKAAGADKYELYRAESKKGPWTKILTTKGTYCNNTKNVVAGKTYYYKVRALADLEGEGVQLKGEYSKIVSGKAKLAAPVMKVKGGKRQIKVSWTKVKDADGYQIYRSTTKNGKYTRIRTSSKASTTYTSVKLKKGKTYYYKMRAYKVVNGKKIYSSFTAPKKAKVK